MKRAQVAVFEMAMVLLVFSVAVGYLSESPTHIDSTQRSYMIESYLGQLSLNSTVRSLVMSENMNSSFYLTGWSQIRTSISTKFPSYELYVRQDAIKKIIVTCKGKYGKTGTEQFIMISGNGSFSVRELGFGVCE